jgi:hypothetical protein
MKVTLPTTLGLVVVAALAGCVEETGMMAPAPGAVFRTTFDGSVSNAAVSACRTALDAQTDGAVQVVGSDFSEANSAVYMRVGANGAPWRCLVSNDGRNPSLTFVGSEGFL